MRGVIRILSVFLLLLFDSCPPTSAGLIAYTASTPGQRSTDFTQSLIVPKFDSTLGSLSEVILSYTNQSVIGGTVMNTSASAQHLTITESTSFMLALGSDQLLSNTLAASQTYTEIPPYVMTNFGTFTPAGGAGSLTLSSGEILTEFEGAGGDVTFDISTLTTTEMTAGGGNVISNISTTAAVTLTVEYEYNDDFAESPVGTPENGPPPVVTNSIAEPSSVILVVMGGLFIALMGSSHRWRRRHSGRG